MYFLGLLQNMYEAPAAFIPCQSLFTGSLFGAPTVIVTTGMGTIIRARSVHIICCQTRAPLNLVEWVLAGIGPENAALCITYLTGALQAC